LAYAASSINYRHTGNSLNLHYNITHPHCWCLRLVLRIAYKVYFFILHCIYCIYCHWTMVRWKLSILWA